MGTTEPREKLRGSQRFLSALVNFLGSTFSLMGVVGMCSVPAMAVDAEESVQGRGDAVLGSVGGGTCSLLASTAAAWSTGTFSCSSTTVA